MLWIGMSGWQYADWRDRLYAGVPQKRWLERYCESFCTVELNASFYRLPKRETFEQWRERTPSDAVFTVKASRYLTHIKRLRDPEEPVARFVGVASALEDRLGPVLIQLPPDLQVDAAALDRTLALFPSTWRLAVEPRHVSWWCDAVRAVLASHNAALVWADRQEKAVTPLWRTADWGYVRFHEGCATWPAYRPAAMTRWARRLQDEYGDSEVFVYFNNDPTGAAVRDSAVLADRADRIGLAHTRTDIPPTA
jgi:uncharacterized protein YecE (DUF72 family)